MTHKKKQPKNINCLLALDPATITTGWAIITIGLQLVSFGTIHYQQSMPVGQRLKGLYDSLASILDSNSQIGAIVIEDQFFSRNTKTLKALSWARGVIMLLAVQRDLPLFVVNNKTAKKLANGKTKEEVRISILQEFHLQEDLDNNVSDAIAIALAYYRQAGGN